MHEIPICETCSSRERCIFERLSKVSLRKIEASKGCNLYKKGQFIFYEGDLPMNVYCIYRGGAKVYKIAENGKEQIIRLADGGEILGYRSVIRSEPYRVIAETLMDSVVCVIPKEIFFHVIKTDESFCRDLVMYLCDELGRCEEQMLNLARKSVTARTAEMLLLLHTKFGFRSDNKTLDVKISREDLANLVGTARESVSRSLREFKDKDLIDLKQDRIQLLDLQRIKKIARIN